MKNFMFACIAIAALSFAIHCWVQPARAQAPGNSVVGVSIAATQSLFGVMVTANGDVYVPSGSAGLWHFSSNIFSGATPVQHESLGQVKARYR